MRLTPWFSRPTGAFPALTANRRVDVAVIGGGITGITAAALLKQRGYSVAVLERERIGSGDTGHTTAHLTAVTDRPIADLVATLGADHAGAVWDAGCAALDQIERLVHEHRIDCGFARVPGYLHVRPDDPHPDVAADDLRRTLTAAEALGIDIAWVERVPFAATPGLRVDDQARIQPHRYLHALANALPGAGISVHERSAVTVVTDAPLRVQVGPHEIAADHVVVATHTPLQGAAGALGAGLAQSRLALYTSYAIRARLAAADFPDALFWDTGDPYRYVRLDPRPDGGYLIIGGGDHKTGQMPQDSPFTQLEAVLAGIDRQAVIEQRWSGQVVEPSDGLPFIGESAPGQFSATGYGGNGLTFGTLAGMMAADWVSGVANPWADLFSWSRSGLAAGGLRNYVRENADYPYYLIRDRFTGRDRRTARAVPRGTGRVIEVQGQPRAIYRADDGAIVERSAVCPHLGCIVAWNAVESTWDCPCHGSRFRPDGGVIAGPAEQPLAAVEAAPEEPHEHPAAR